MAIINKGTAFSNGEQLSASKLNNLLDGATFGTDSVDNSSTLLNGSGAITVRDSGITAAKIADANVTFAKLTDVIDDDTMATATDTTLATSKSIKAYVDGTNSLTTNGYSVLPGGLIIQWGFVETTQSAGSYIVNFPLQFPNACLNATATLQKPFTDFDGAATVQTNLLSATQFKLGFDQHSVSSGNKSAFWQAIGH